MTIFGRIVLPTTLDPVPRGLRTAPGCVALNLAEIAALERRDLAALEHVTAVIISEDFAALERKYGRSM